MPLPILLAALILLWPAVVVVAEELRSSGRMDHGPMGEVSGLVAGGGDRFWVHNDSGDSARLFSINRQGEVQMPAYLQPAYQDTPWPGLAVLNAWNVDWEDIARSRDGVLYLADMGNNGNARRDLGVYVLPEPNPLAVDRARALRFLPVRYPDQSHYPARQWHFDCEAVFHDPGKLYFVTKHRKPGEITGWAPGAKLYRLDSDHSDRENTLTLVGKNPSVTLATAADLSADGGHLAIATYLGVWLFARPASGDDWLTGESRFVELPRKQLKSMEAITWLGERTLMLANEERELYELDLSSLP